MTPNDANVNRELVLAVNELFHDLEGEEYDDVHPEIFEAEPRRWKRLFQAHVKNLDQPKTVLDLGSGTGFVGEQMKSMLRPGDTLICADLSAKMLAIATGNLQKLYPDIQVQGLKLADETLPLPDASVDIVTMNSVLHHIPNSEKFLSEINRILRTDGLLFIGHEPNIRFVRHLFLSRQVPFLSAIMPKRILANILRAVGLLKAKQKKGSDAFLDRINTELTAKGLITTPLTRSQISQLVDVHSPTAGGVRRDEGFDPWNVLENTAMNVETVETYNHLSKMSGRHAWLMVYEELLAVLAPKSGATFFLVGRKDLTPGPSPS